MKVAIAGASGFVGELLIKHLPREIDLVGFRRSSTADKNDSAARGREGLEWRTCDLFSLLQTEEALKGIDIAIYLVHSMLPTARLMQSTFENCDLLLADNFARGCRKMGVKRIIYLGGLIPESVHLSRHLLSRLEVEQALASQGASVTTLRSGLIIGPQGSSFQMLYLLVKRLPIMICPKWTESLTQPIPSEDVVKLIEFCISEPKTAGQSFDIGSPTVLTYRALLTEVAKQMGLKRRFFTVTYFSPGLSSLWVRLITGASKNLVAPLIESLQHEMVVHDKTLLQMYGKPLKDFRVAIKECLEKIKPNLHRTTVTRRTSLRKSRDVRSIQRLPLPKDYDAKSLAQEYFRWLPQFLAPVIKVSSEVENIWNFKILFFKPVLILEYAPNRSTPDRQLFYINGGLLALAGETRRGRLEFREVLDKRWAIAAINDYRPRLPWLIYTYTQALVHLWVMRNFARHLRRLQGLKPRSTVLSDKP